MLLKVKRERRAGEKLLAKDEGGWKVRRTRGEERLRVFGSGRGVREGGRKHVLL